MCSRWTFTGKRRENHQQLFGLSLVDLEVVLPAPVHKVQGQFSALPVILICDEANNGSDRRELLQEASGHIVCEISSVDGEKQRCHDGSLLGLCCRSACQTHSYGILVAR